MDEDALRQELAAYRDLVVANSTVTALLLGLLVKRGLLRSDEIEDIINTAHLALGGAGDQIMNSLRAHVRDSAAGQPDSS